MIVICRGVSSTVKLSYEGAGKGRRDLFFVFIFRYFFSFFVFLLRTEGGGGKRRKWLPHAATSEDVRP